MTVFATLMGRNANSDLIKAYAESIGKTVRTAQRHAKPDHPRHADWVHFLGLTAAEGVQRKNDEGHMAESEAAALSELSPLAPSGCPEFYDVDESELDPVQLMEKRAWELHDKTFQQWEQAQRSPGGAALATVLIQAIPKLREDYLKAKTAREEADLRKRVVISRGEFEAFVSNFILPIAELMRSIPTELATVVNPDNPSYALNLLIEWQRTRAEPSVAEMLKSSEEFLAA